MNKNQKYFVTPLIMLGILTMVLTALAFAEKEREDGHLPERNDRGSGEILSMIAVSGLTGLLVPVFRSGCGDVTIPAVHTTHPSSMGMRCPTGFYF